MKKVFYFAAAMLLTMGMVACDPTEDDNNNGNNTNDSTPTNPTIPTTPTEGEWIDMGLESGVDLLWRSCNLGAESPEQYGNYYAWGETQPKEVYGWSTYAWGSNYDALTKYCDNSEYGLYGYTDELDILEPADDAASVALGGDARMPSYADWNSLLSGTRVEWTTVNGVNGCMFISKTNGNCIFLPAMGYLSDEGGEPGVHRDSVWGFYWASVLVGHDCAGAYDIEFGSGIHNTYAFTRCYGLPIRAVRPAGKK
ncbi:MAG: hypothetical protein J5711_07450 [Bacteroidales bacterium]|nr:hypothetical protein [Bacteroidales bacterium]